MALGIGLYLYLFSSVKQWNLIGFFGYVPCRY